MVARYFGATAWVLLSIVGAFNGSLTVPNTDRTFMELGFKKVVSRWNVRRDTTKVRIMTENSRAEALATIEAHYGQPASQGSKTGVIMGGRAVIIPADSAKGKAKLSNWRQDVTSAARTALECHGRQFTGAVAISLDFRFQLPKSDQHRTLHTTPIDVDKAARAVLDAIVNSGLLHDDSLVCDLRATKTYARDGDSVGCDITITDLAPLEAMYRETSKVNAKLAKKAAK
jgi:Holliday junction resolvase RusA-like endonuclease